MELVNRVVAKIEAISRQQFPELRDPADVAKIRADSLLFYYGNAHSQRGQDGVLAEIFRRLGIVAGAFVEFGAWDGIYLSNSRYLFERGWRGTFIEGDRERFKALARNYRGTVARVINAFVGTRDLRGTRLTDLLDSAAVDFISIDVDGPDLEIFEDMEIRPAVVLLEGGFNFSPAVEIPVAVDIARRNIQQPIAVICATAKAIGYVPVCFYQDTYFVRNDLAGPFAERSAISLYSDAFHFMPAAYRQSLIDARERSTAIRQHEMSFFGHFSADPLAYHGRTKSNS